MKFRFSRPVAGAVLCTLLLAGVGIGAYVSTAGSKKQAAVDPRPRAGSLLNQHPVAKNFKPDATKLASCSDQKCYEQAFGNLTYYQGPKRAIALFDEKQRTEQAIESGCHRIAHVMGAAALTRYKGDVSRAFAEGTSTCWSGYYHGILERSLAGAQTKEDFAAVSRRVCRGKVVHSSQFLYYQCVHGLGHGVMIQSGYNLPFSLSICERLQTTWDQTSCDGGVFMENVNGATTTIYGFKSPWLKDKDLIFPCDAVKERHKLYCYLMVTSRILQANGYDWAATAKICAGVERDWRATCFQSYGRDASGDSRGDPNRIVALCGETDSFMAECVYGASRDLTAQDTGGKRAATMCNTAPKWTRAKCFYGIGTILSSFGPAGGAAACKPLTVAYRAECVRGATGL
jgi:hypothetical protein